MPSIPVTIIVDAAMCAGAAGCTGAAYSTWAGAAKHTAEVGLMCSTKLVKHSLPALPRRRFVAGAGERHFTTRAAAYTLGAGAAYFLSGAGETYFVTRVDAA